MAHDTTYEPVLPDWLDCEALKRIDRGQREAAQNLSRAGDLCAAAWLADNQRSRQKLCRCGRSVARFGDAGILVDRDHRGTKD